MKLQAKTRLHALQDSDTVYRPQMWQAVEEMMRGDDACDNDAQVEAIGRKHGIDADEMRELLKLAHGPRGRN